jgi:hypothetical protein
MAERAQKRQEDRLDRAIYYEFLDRRLGLFLGFFALIGILTAGLIALALGYDRVGIGLLSFAGIGTVVGAFIHGRRNGEEEEEEETPAPSDSRLPPPEKPSRLKRIWDAISGR